MTTIAKIHNTSSISRVVEEEEAEEGYHFHHTCCPLREAPIESSCGGGIIILGVKDNMHRHDDGQTTHVLTRRDTPTDSTLFSSAISSPSGACDGSCTHQSHKKEKQRSPSQRKQLDRFRHRIRIPNILKRYTTTKKKINESQLRKKVKKYVERNDWNGIRKLISGYEFREVPEVLQQQASCFNAVDGASQAQGGSVVPPIQEDQGSSSGSAHRRPSYGSRNGERRSGGLGGESAAAAAVIKAAMLEESSGSNPLDCSSSNEGNRRLDIGDNILHDVCQYHPPLDVVETLLVGLRHRRGSTCGTDDTGCTPLHLAVMSGSKPEVIEALVRADPTPATMGDGELRSPLHLAMRYLVNHGMNPEDQPVTCTNPTHRPQHHHTMHQEEQRLSPQEAIEQTLNVVRILKEAMLTYPGRIDFKDEDKSGYSALDYAIDGNVQDEVLIQSLIRRREVQVRRTLSKSNSSRIRRSNANCGRSVFSYSSVNETQDIDVLHQLEQDEIEARKARLSKMKSFCKKEKKKTKAVALYDVFGIDQTAHSIHASAASVSLLEQDVGSAFHEPSVQQEQDLQGGGNDEPLLPVHEKRDSLTNSAIFNQHLQAYMDDYMNEYDYGILETSEKSSSESFDIFQDPELDGPAGRRKEEEEAQVIRPIHEGVLPQEVEFGPDQIDDCSSVVSEMTIPAVFHRVHFYPPLNK